MTSETKSRDSSQARGKEHGRTRAWMDMNGWQSAGSSLERWLGGFLPRSCLLCETACGAAALCPACAVFLPGAHRPRCRTCARPWQVSSRCASCRAPRRLSTRPSPPRTMSRRSTGRVTSLKFSGRIGLASGLGGLLADRWRNPGLPELLAARLPGADPARRGPAGRARVQPGAADRGGDARTLARAAPCAPPARAAARTAGPPPGHPAAVAAAIGRAPGQPRPGLRRRRVASTACASAWSTTS